LAWPAGRDVLSYAPTCSKVVVVSVAELNAKATSLLVYLPLASMQARSKLLSVYIQ
jgi:hypothetical protein